MGLVSYSLDRVGCQVLIIGSSLEGGCRTVRGVKDWIMKMCGFLECRGDQFHVRGPMILLGRSGHHRGLGLAGT